MSKLRGLSGSGSPATCGRRANQIWQRVLRRAPLLQFRDEKAVSKHANAPEPPSDAGRLSLCPAWTARRLPPVARACSPYRTPPPVRTQLALHSVHGRSQFCQRCSRCDRRLRMPRRRWQRSLPSTCHHGCMLHCGELLILATPSFAHVMQPLLPRRSSMEASRSCLPMHCGVAPPTLALGSAWSGWGRSCWRGSR